MADTRHKDSNWALPEKLSTWEQAQVAIQMDILDELKKLNALLHCHNTVAIPRLLRSILRKLPIPKPKRKARK